MQEDDDFIEMFTGQVHCIGMIRDMEGE